MREVGSRSVVAGIVLLAGAWMPLGALGQAPAQAASATWLKDDLALLADADRSLAERSACAQRLIAASADRQTAQRVAEVLAGAQSAGNAASLLLQALSQSPAPPATLYQPLAKRLQSAPAREKPALLAALSAYRTREAATLLLQEGSLSSDPAVQVSAFDALARLSGRDDLGVDVHAWERWLQDARRLSDPQWHAALLTAHLDRGGRLELLRDETTQRLTESLRRMHLALPDADRSEFLASLLRDDLRAVRDLGFELVSRELAASHDVDASVAQAAGEHLRLGDAATRVQAARLVRQIAPDSAAGAVAAALAQETDPSAAAALLDAAARWPAPELSPVVGRWLSNDAAVRRAAVGAAWSLARAGVLADDERRRSLQVLRETPLDALGPSACLLLDRLGSDNDRALIAGQLASGHPENRLAAAQALLGDPDYTPAIIGAAAQDAGLFASAAQAILLDYPSLPGFQRLADLPAPSPAARREGRLLVAQALPAPDLLAAARAANDASDREDLIDLLLAPERIMSEAASPHRLEAIVLGALDRARSRCADGRPDEALPALDAVARYTSGAQARRVVRMETIALLTLDRVEAAEKLDADAEAWLEGLRACLGKPHAADVADALAFRFLGTLSDDQLRAFADLAAQARSQPAAAPGGPPGGG